MAKVVTATNLRTRIREVIQSAQFQGDHIIMTVFDKPAVAIIGIDDYRDYLTYRGQQQKSDERKEPPQAVSKDNSTLDELTDEELHRKLGI